METDGGNQVHVAFESLPFYQFKVLQGGVGARLLPHFDKRCEFFSLVSPSVSPKAAAEIPSTTIKDLGPLIVLKASLDVDTAGSNL